MHREKKVQEAKELLRVYACVNVLLEFPYTDPELIQQYIREGKDRNKIVKQLTEMEGQELLEQRNRHKLNKTADTAA